ncbi:MULTISPECIES: NFACT family protein [unclassified Oceanispirochaeta]|uniref:NFACT RNA binding domain-containing protein n=1 Tax=unclassified Oceanispirochaeta TaxID=2635722 RepID=UPI000E0918E3|nr:MULTISPECIES: NFACT family protein [unclassified Oceanispirochaeta]MBF9018444.1 NFACT family protein [Oceanispirochaeta sp. M2]RDG30355.1 fibronectin-binding domain-containing protein [Oceanispirochaeta sp. M1]
MNWLEIDKILEELPLEGSFLQNIRQSSYSHLIFEFHRPGRSLNLLVSLERDSLRIHEMSRKEKSLPKPPRFTSYMRSRIKGARILKAKQLGTDRIIRLDLKKGNLRDILYIRLWGGAANLILCDSENFILDAFSRRPARDEVPGKLYAPPADSPAPKKQFVPRSCPENYETYNAFFEDLYSDREQSEDIRLLREKALRLLKVRENGIRARLKTLEERVSGYMNENIYREDADILMSSLHLITKGQKTFIPEETKRVIPLNNSKTAVENAQDLYKKASKASRGRALTEEEIENQQQKLKSVEKELTDLDEITDPDILKQMIPPEKEVIKSSIKPSPGLQFESGGFPIIVGRSAKENEAILGSFVRGNDYWLHTRDYPGAYVFIRLPRGKTVPLETLLDAGNLALFYSKAKNSAVADLYYTQVKYLRKPKEGKRGLVLPTREKNLHIKLDEDRIRRLKGLK